MHEENVNIASFRYVLKPQNMEVSYTYPHEYNVTAFNSFYSVLPLFLYPYTHSLNTHTSAHTLVPTYFLTIHGRN